jgi:hypothetical protein
MNRIIRLSSLFIGLLLVTSCLEQIDLRVDPEFQDNIVIQGSLIQGNPSKVNVRVTKLFDFTSNGREAVTVRYVRLTDEEGNEVELELGNEIGDYQLTIPVNDPRINIAPGKFYQIEVSTFDGRVFQSEPEQLIPVPEPQNLTARRTIVESIRDDGTIDEDEFIEFLISTPTNNGVEEPTFLRWVTERTFRTTDEGLTEPPSDPKTCYVTESTLVNNVPSASGQNFAGQINDLAILQERLDARFAEGYYLSVFQQSLTRGAFNYWAGVGQLINREGTIFEPPVGKLVSNIKNIDDPDDEAFGYFYAAQQDTIRLFVSPEFADTPSVRCPVIFDTVDPNFDYCESVPLCCNCLSADRSQLERPDFWVE